MSYKNLKTWAFFSISSFICTIYLILLNYGTETYKAIYALPLVFLGCNIVFANVYNCIDKNIGVLVLHILMFVRLVVTPFFMAQAEFSSTFHSLTEDDINYAILLLSYECIAIYIVLSVLSAKYIGQYSSSEYQLHYSNPTTLFKTITLFMTIFCLMVWLLIPSCRELYSTIFEIGDLDFTTVDYSASDEAVGSLSRSFQTLFKMFFDILRLVVPMYLLVKLKIQHYKHSTGMFVGLLFAAVQMLFISSTTARSVICAFLIIYFISRLYQQYARKIIRTAMVVSVGLVITYFVVRFFVGSRYGENAMEYLSRLLTAYFGGLDNVAAGSNIPKGYEGSTFFASLYSAIPFNSTLFGLKVEKLQSIYNEANASYGQIPPMIVEGEYYFGFWFSPIMSCICAIGAYHFGAKYTSTNSPWHLISNLFIAIMFAIAIVMYNEEIFLVWLLEWLVPIKILSYIAEVERK